MVKEETPKEIMKRLSAWNKQAHILRACHILLGVIAILSSVSVASRIVSPDSTAMSWIAWLAAVTSATITSMNLEVKSNNMRTAWRILNTAILRYQTEDNFKIEDLNAAYKIGEEIVGDVKINLSK